MPPESTRGAGKKPTTASLRNCQITGTMEPVRRFPTRRRGIVPTSDNADQIEEGAIRPPACSRMKAISRAQPLANKFVVTA